MSWNYTLGRGWLKAAVADAMRETDSNWERRFDKLKGPASPAAAQSLDRLVRRGKKLSALHVILSRKGR